MEKGDRVIATEDLGGGWFGSSVPKGTEGVIVEVSESLFSSDELKVRFANGELLEVSPSQISRI